MSQLDPTTLGVAATALAAASGAVFKALQASGKHQAQISELQREKVELQTQIETLRTAQAKCVTSEEFGAFSRMLTELVLKQTGEVGRLAGIAESIRRE